MLQGELVYLRPPRAQDLPLLADRANDVTYLTDYNFFGLRRAGQVEESFRDDGLLGIDHGTLLVVTRDGDEIAGDVSYRRVRYGPGDASAAYNIGITLAPERRGQGYGSEAQRLLADYLFATFPIMRVEASTDCENHAEQRALEKAGFNREGVLRKTQWRNGAWHDLVVYSRIRGD
ncbi:MAG TPA: GNAT family protein [Ktedonobacterales bacterium]